MSDGSANQKLDPRTYERALSCVHCGLCLPVCPTYLQTGLEAEGPRGRIQLMRGISDGNISATQAVRGHLDSCLDCRACETACPSNVVYHELIEETRQHIAPSGASPGAAWLVKHILPFPERLKWALMPARILQRLGLWKVIARGKFLRMLPEDGPVWPGKLPRRSGSAGAKIRIGFFGGCVGQSLFGDVNRKAIELLAACGAEVIAPDGQVCCGALHYHDGDAKTARRMARRNVDEFSSDGKLDFVVTAVAGCGAMLRDYGLLLRDDSKYRERAATFGGSVRDICQVLDELPMPPMKHAIHMTVTYHDACHLAHGQKVTAEPRRLLGKIPGLKLAELAESDLCCGAAGSYNLTHPKMASDLAERKLKNISATGARTVVAGNVGCALRLAAEAKMRGDDLRIVHPVELLHQAVFGARVE